jgi:type II secretory pathway pseudopilin PulG
MLIGQKGKEQEAYRFLPAKEKRISKKLSSFTLVETLIAAFILGILLVSLFATLNIGQFSDAVGSARIDLQANLRNLMDWIVRDVRQTYPIQINSNDPSVNHIKFKKVVGIDNTTGNHTVSARYTEYIYNNTTLQLRRNELNDTGSVLFSLVFSNITASHFYSDVGVPLYNDTILGSGKLIVVISGQKQARNNVLLNLNLNETITLRNE